MAVKAPFQFARIPRAVWFPEWRDLVSHDVPFEDGYCGTITLEIEAKTPLLIGGPRERKDGQPGEVWPVQLPDGSFAIPPSSLQGMVRNILEIATFGKLGPWVDERRFGIRDISGTETGKAVYGSRMTKRSGGIIYHNAKAGWLVRTAAGQHIVPCAFSRIHVDEIVKLSKTTGQATDVLRAALLRSSDAKKRYAAFTGCPSPLLDVQVTCRATRIEPHSGGKQISESRCIAFGPDAGTLVITGKSSGGDGNGQKKWDFIFHGPDRNAAPTSTKPQIPVLEKIWDGFLAIHQPPKGSGKGVNPNWAYWEADFKRGEPVPIFYLETVDKNRVPIKDTVATMGTAFMFKIAHELNTHQMLAHSSTAHLDQSEYDLPSLIFGGVGGAGNDNRWFKHSLKRRASFGWASATLPGDKTKPETSAPTILLAPKPSYYPIYVRQQPAYNNRTNLYASYTPVEHGAGTNAEIWVRPELAGAKIWPVRPDGREIVLPVPIGANVNITNIIHPLPAGTTFTVDLRIHNLRAFELGALLWALTYGDPDALAGGEVKYRHRIGMGKPGNFGSLAIRVAEEQVPLQPNNEAHSAPKLADLVTAFVGEMNSVCARIAGSVPPPKWTETVQYKALIQQADSNAPGPGLGDYMRLNNGENGEPTYVNSRAAGDFIAPFVTVGQELKRNGNPTQPAPPPDREGRRPQLSPGPLLEPVNGARVKIGNREGTIVWISPPNARIRFDSDGGEQTLKLGKNLFTVLSHPAARPG